MNHLNGSSHHELYLVVFGKPMPDLEEKPDFLWSGLLFEGLCEPLGYKLDALSQIYHTSDAGVNNWSGSLLGMQHIPANCRSHVQAFMQQVSIDREWLLQKQKPRRPSQRGWVWALSFSALWHARLPLHMNSMCGFRLTEHGLAKKLTPKRSSAEGAFSLILICILVCRGMPKQLHSWCSGANLTFLLALSVLLWAATKRVVTEWLEVFSYLRGWDWCFLALLAQVPLLWLF